LASFVLSWHRRYLRKHADFTSKLLNMPSTPLNRCAVGS
jgi:hypothetical protein